MIQLPSLFVSHGAPSLILEDCPARDFLRRLGQDLGRPKAIVCVSAHWESAHIQVSAAPSPRTIYDFSGFPRALYETVYPAPGAPELAERICQLLKDSGLTSAIDATRGLDHGAWVPLALMYPDAGIPVLQLSVQPHQPGSYHIAVGRALASLRAEGILMLASGSAIHNLRELRWTGADAPPAWATEFSKWLRSAVEEGDHVALAGYRDSAPWAELAHPTPDHFIPLLVALGAGGPDSRGRCLHSSFTYGSLSMAAFSFES